MTAPVWGCPWHGLVSNGVLALPNGQSMVWPAALTGSLACQAGATHLIDIPGVPEIVRSAEEAAADAAAGWQWRRTALLAGAGMSLHGTALGGWVYCAPDGARWHVPATAFSGLAFGVANWVGEVELRRFGVLGGVEDVRTLPFELDPQQPVIDGISAPLIVDVHAISGDGARAILMAYVRESVLRESGAGVTGLQQLPVGFYMVTLSGSASDLALSVAVLYDQEQTLGEAGSAFPPISPIGDRPGTVQVGPWHAFYRDRIVGAWFSGEAVVPVKWSMEWSGALNNPAPSGSPAARTCTATTDMLWTLKSGDSLIDSITGRAEFELYQREPVDGVGVEVSTGAITVEGETVGGSSTHPFDGRFGGGEGPWFLNNYGGETARGRLINTGFAMICADDVDRFWLLDIQRYSNNLLGLRLRKRRYTDNLVTVDYRRAGHPGGDDSSTLTVAGSASSPAVGHLPYGSYNPSTGDVVRNQFDPVCWV